MQQHLGVQPKMQPRARRDASGFRDADAPASPKVDAPDDLKDRREHRARQPLAVELLEKAEKAFPNGMNTTKGKLTSLRDIQGALHIRQNRAQVEVQAHFKSLQAVTA